MGVKLALIEASLSGAIEYFPGALSKSDTDRATSTLNNGIIDAVALKLFNSWDLPINDASVYLKLKNGSLSDLRFAGAGVSIGVKVSFGELDIFSDKMGMDINQQLNNAFGRMLLEKIESKTKIANGSIGGEIFRFNNKDIANFANPTKWWLERFKK